MSTSFNVNKADLEFILKQIEIAESTSLAYRTPATVLSMLQAIQAVFPDVSVSQAAILPFGLRTVDGSDNNLIPGQSDFGAADTLFPRLTDPVFRNETDGDSIDFDGAGPGPALVQGNYGDVNGAAPGGIVSVVDADPRIISNLIVDMTAGNPAAVDAALKYLVFTGAMDEATKAAAAVAIAEAYARTQSSNAGDVADISDNAASAVVTAVNAIGATLFGAPIDQVDIDSALAARDAADAAHAKAQLVVNALIAAGVGAPELTAANDVVTNAATLALDLMNYHASLVAGNPVTVIEITAVANAASLALANETAAQALTVQVEALVGLPVDAAAVAQARAELAVTLDSYGIEVDPSGSLVIPNTAPDAGLTAPFNAWMTFFGQFFDHGLDLVTKGGNGTVYVPLRADDPLIAGADGVLGTGDDLPAELRFMALTRATVTMVDPDGAGPLPAVPQHENTTTSFVDQNQTYTSHSSHQAFLREYVRVDATTVVATGHLLEGSAASGSFAGAPGNWAEVKAQALEMLGIALTDFDVHNVPLLLTDQYGQLIRGANGYAQMVMADLSVVEGTAAGISTVGSLGTGHAFLNDIAHNAAPVPGLIDPDRNPGTNNSVVMTADTDTLVGNAQTVSAAGVRLTYDDELLNSHFITGDGRGNENIALTAVHSVFHSEHNRMVEANKATILATGDLAFLNEWLRVDVAGLTPAQIQALNPASLQWDGERLFQAARFSTEMQYQHMVFEEFARRINPDIDPFIFNIDSTIDASILAEFAHTVYRFGHSMLTGTVDRLDNNLNTVDGGDQASLLAAFLNPQMYLASGTSQEAVLANLARGLSRDVGNNIDEFIVQDLRSNLLGLPLDLAVLNIARGRDTGIPSLNETRQQLHDAGVSILAPYTSWLNFADNINNKLSLINFIAAYGTHASITSATTTAEARDAATLLVFGGAGAPADRLDFLNATGIYAGGSLGGLNNIDLWIGGLAEKRPEFGSAMLGQTFNYVFEFQMEQLQFGDRFYYLSRTQGTNFLSQLEPNTFADMVMRNSELGGDYATHLSSALFITPDLILELDRGIAQEDYNGLAPGLDPDWETPPSLPVAKVERDYSSTTPDPNNAAHDFGGSIIFRGAEHTVIGGTEGNDYIRTDEGDDTIWGDGGDDHLISGDGVDNVFGGDGDDVIEDNEGGGDFLRGERGNDVIYSGRGAFDVLFGGAGNDFVHVGLDVMEVFAGEDDDFVLGGAGSDLLMGGEGNDWIEGGGGFDTLVGENSELFFNSPIIGHDVLFGNGDETDVDAESGDDIMASSPSVFRNEGMFGFDWGIAKFDPSEIDFDLNVPVFTTDQADILRDRWDQVEALSGWNGNDKLSGDDRGHVDAALFPSAITPSELFVNNVLDQAGINRIAGFNEWFGGDANGNMDGTDARVTLGFRTIFDVNNTPNNPLDDILIQGNYFREGNILMGGDGNDVIKGRGGYDVIDGDAWLNVRIKIVIGSGPDAGTYSAESLSTDNAVMGPNAGKVFNTNPDGSTNFNSVAFGGRSLPALLLDRTINPGEMSIVREIKYDDTNPTGISKNVDTAVYQGTMGEYIIEGLETSDINYTGDVISHAQDLDGDGFISVRDTNTGAGGVIQALDGDGNVIDVQAPPRALGPAGPAGGGTPLVDDLDLLKNIEQLQFVDRTFQIGDPSAIVNWNGVRPGENALPANGVVIANLSTTDVDNTPVTWSMIGGTAPVTVSGGGVVTTTAALAANTSYTLTVRATETGNPTAFVDKSISIQTGGGGDNTLTGSGLTDVIYGLAGDDTINGLGNSDTLFGQAGDDILNGGVGNDDLTGGTGDDQVNGSAGSDTIRYRIGDGIDEVDGGTGVDRLIITATAAAGETLLALYDGIALTEFGSIGEDGIRGTVTNVESVIADLGGGANDDLDYFGSTAAVTVDLGAGTASGFTSIAGIEDVAGSAGNDSLTGSNAANALFGEGGNDTINGAGGNDTINYMIGDGADTVDGGAGVDTLNISAAGGAQELDVIYNGASLTSVEGGTVTGVESVTASLGGGTDTLNYAGSTAAVTVNLGAGTASGFTSIAGIENVTGSNSNDSLTGNGQANELNGAGGNDTINGGAVGDTLIGGAGSDSINTGAANDNQVDIIRFSATNEFGDTITNFDVTGTGLQRDVVEFEGALSDAYDDGTIDGMFQFVTGIAGDGNTTNPPGLGLGSTEALLLINGVTAAELTNLGQVSGAINSEFVLGGTANGDDAILVVDASGSNNFGVYQWISNGVGETGVAELTLIGVFTANSQVTADNIVFF